MPTLSVDEDTATTRPEDGAQALPWSGGLGWHYAWQSGMDRTDDDPAVAAPAGTDADWRVKLEAARRAAEAGRRRFASGSISGTWNAVGMR